MSSGFKKYLNLQIHQHKTLFLDDRFLDSIDKSFLNQTWHDAARKIFGPSYFVTDLALLTLSK